MVIFQRGDYGSWIPMVSGEDVFVHVFLTRPHFGLEGKATYWVAFHAESKQSNSDKQGDRGFPVLNFWGLFRIIHNQACFR